jgi:hypothetical protein
MAAGSNIDDDAGKAKWLGHCKRDNACNKQFTG